MSEHLLDADVLLALAWPQHEQHAAAHAWFEAVGRHAWATCPAVQLAFVLRSTDPAVVPDPAPLHEALDVLHAMAALPGHRFWRDHVALYLPALRDAARALSPDELRGAYLIELARRNAAALATFDRRLLSVCDALGVSTGVVVLIGS